ncbi:MAG: twin-arginine translocase TatA/TatE family subunit [Planctomycetes bacterium]|jgi:sec-independent protein translocase protein TatA|nr:twin-arginine translocase TatA/TatE family subunit [Planctomycetota bacterium]
MIPRIGPLELVLILVIVILLFGVGRIGKIAGEIGSGIRNFRDGLKSDEDKKEAKKEEDSSK